MAQVLAASFCDWHFYEAEAHASNCRASETCYGKPENLGIKEKSNASAFGTGCPIYTLLNQLGGHARTAREARDQPPLEGRFP
jgi:hypothetical protein